jgi:isoleucyl-tRNA synthetase
VASRVLDVGNPWLDAGIVPFSTLGYRHDRAAWREWFPADFITEAFPGQYRNWFYSMLVMSTVLENREPYRMCLGHAMVRDEQGREMHKSWGNMIEFNEAAEKMGSDVVRWLYAVQNPAQNVSFGYGPADDVRRRFILPLWNVYAFFVTYANLDGFTARPANALRAPLVVLQGQPAVLDRWVQVLLHRLIRTVRERLDDYDVPGAARAIERFVDDLSLWYVRRGRRRYWKSELDADKQAAYQTLYEVLVALCRLLAPFVPFLAEALYQNLVRSIDASAPESVHLCDVPIADSSVDDPTLLEDTERVRELVSIGRAARNAAKIRVRQPLEAAIIVDRSGAITRNRELSDHIQEELNVKTLRVVDSYRALGKLEVRPRFDLLGPKFGGRIGEIVEALRERGDSLVDGTPEREPLRLALRNGDEVVLERAEVEVRVQWRPGLVGAGEAGAWVALVTTLTDDLLREGMARELVHQIQQLRKEAGFRIADRIMLYYEGDSALIDVLQTHRDYVLREVLGQEARPGVPTAAGAVHRKALRMDGRVLTVGIAQTN